MTMTASPAAASMPAVIATWWPKLRESSISRKRGSTATTLRRYSTLPSRLPSSTKIASASPSNRQISELIRSISRGSTCSSLYMGRTSEYRGGDTFTAVLMLWITESRMPLKMERKLQSSKDTQEIAKFSGFGQVPIMRGRTKALPQSNVHMCSAHGVNELSASPKPPRSSL
ncbi:hypothetical protein MES5069_240016 [Mesorhizobium escarrei]|uniref:Uncharacterized protein n=1 Tax=Mesorhizobium escarrei TaxID=666018 RepID=A0ABN8JSF2_9HYPH|nr:hypothetical protein MES5069_240016 [Mesorhizobium escarrei]